jgi:hypothetical protein
MCAFVYAWSHCVDHTCTPSHFAHHTGTRSHVRSHRLCALGGVRARWRLAHLGLEGSHCDVLGRAHHEGARHAARAQEHDHQSRLQRSAIAGDHGWRRLPCARVALRRVNPVARVRAARHTLYKCMPQRVRNLAMKAILHYCANARCCILTNVSKSMRADFESANSEISAFTSTTNQSHRQSSVSTQHLTVC